MWFWGGGSCWFLWFPLSVRVVWLLGLRLRVGWWYFDLFVWLLCIGVGFGYGSCCGCVCCLLLVALFTVSCVVYYLIVLFCFDSLGFSFVY